MNLIFRGGYYLTVPKYSGRRKGECSNPSEGGSRYLITSERGGYNG